ncbi:MAG: peptidoglycan-binding domain-containing protein [Nocardioidaceae bacterium]
MRGVIRAVAIAVVGVVAVGGVSAPTEALTSSQIRSAQWKLNKLGCQAGPVDGRAGSMTQAATVRFQAASRLSQTGSLNSTTRSRLHSSSAKSCSNRPRPANSGTGRRIVLSQSQNWVWLLDSHSAVITQGGVIDNPSVLSRGTYYSGPKCGRAARIRKTAAG